MSLNSLGALRARQSRFAEAESLFNWALAWIERFCSIFWHPESFNPSPASPHPRSNLAKATNLGQ